MANNLVLHKTSLNDRIENSEDLLKGALEIGFESIVLVGIRNGRCHIMSSKMDNRHTMVGMLEDAKHELLG